MGGNSRLHIPLDVIKRPSVFLSGFQSLKSLRIFRQERRSKREKHLQ